MGNPQRKPNGHLGSYDIQVVQTAEQDIVDYNGRQHKCDSAVVVYRNQHGGQIPDSGNFAVKSPVSSALPDERENAGDPLGHGVQAQYPYYG